MRQFLACVFLVFLTLRLSISLSQEKNLKLKRANELYFLPNPTENDDQEAIRLFIEVLKSTPKQTEVIEFIQATERLGTLLLTYENPTEAIQHYRQGIAWARVYGISDTLLYSHHLFLGEALFSQSEIDSSLAHLQVAERLQSQLSQQGEPERLYNALGVYFFETGNYIRSVTYFDKALSYLTGEKPELELYAKYSFKSNKASALYHLGEYDSAQRIYHELLGFGINQDQLRINLANTYLQKNEGDMALETLSQISQAYQQVSLSYFNLKAKSQLSIGAIDSAEVTLEFGKRLILEDSPQSKSYQKGIWLEVKGDLLRSQGQYEIALKEYQKALVQLLPGFEDLEVTSNPGRFALGMSSLTVFEILRKKAEVSWEIYRKTHEKIYFDLGLGALESALGLVQFISVNFDNDEARIFLGEKALETFESGIEQLMTFAEVESRQDLVWKAFDWAEQIKAGGLRIGAMQESLKRKSQLPEDLIQEERKVLFAIFRNNQRQFDALSPEMKSDLEKEALDLEVQLSRLREKFKKYPGFAEDIQEEFDPWTFQQTLPQKSFVLSFFMGKSHLFVFGMGKEIFSWKKIPHSEIPFSELNQWIGDLVKVPSGSRYQLNQEIGKFGDDVLGDFEQAIGDAQELILIPQGIFNALPFELLPDKSGRYLYERIPLIYQFSAQFVQPIQGRNDLKNGLGFAPFSDSENQIEFASLPQSQVELEAFEGEKLLGKEAIKTRFLEKAGEAEFVHLATHAVASSADPNYTFIAFYPEGEDFRLFAPELAYQSLEKAKLVFLSACETGAGQLSKSEGLISLARSLAFAGAEQMVITQWVSEDRVAAYLSGRFYHYVGDGMTFASALFQAKLDLLDDSEMAQFHHPFYWANFRIFGQPNESHFPNPWIIGFGILVILLPTGFWIWTKFSNRRSSKS